MSIKILLSDGLPLVVSRTLVAQVGLEQALVLQQVHYWLDPKRSQNFFQDKYWVHNTYQQWQKQFSFWRVKKIQRLFSLLETQGFLLSFTRYNNCYKTKFYTINYEKLGLEKPFPSPLSPNGHTMTPNLSHGKNKSGRPSGQNRIHKRDNSGPQNKAIRGFQTKDQIEITIVPKADDNEDSNGCTIISKVSNGEDKSEGPSGQKRTCKFDNFELASEELRAFQGKDKMGSIVSPKVGDGEDRMGCTIIPKMGGHEDKNGLLYKLITENTNKEDPPPLTPPPSQHLAASTQEEEEKSKKEKKEKTPASLFQRMVHVWNEMVQWRLSDVQAVLTPRRLQRFEAFLKESAVSDVRSWKQYCQKIRESRFLCGENASGFRISLDWALKAENAQKILEGAIYDKRVAADQAVEERFTEQSWAEYVAGLKRHCKENAHSDRWFRVCLDLAHRVGQHTFHNWFKGIVPKEGAEVLTLETNSAFIRDYINTHYEGELQKAIRTAFPPQTQVKMRVADPLPTSEQALPDFCVNHRQRPDVTCSGDADVQVAARTSLSQTSPSGV